MTEKPNSVCKWCQQEIKPCWLGHVSNFCEGWLHMSNYHVCEDGLHRAEPAEPSNKLDIPDTARFTDDPEPSTSLLTVDPSKCATHGVTMESCRKDRRSGCMPVVSASPQKSIPAADLLRAAGHRCKPETCGCLCGTSYSKEWKPVISHHGMGGGAPKCKCVPQPVAGELQLAKGWLQRQMDNVEKDIATWPDWMKKAAGIVVAGEGPQIHCQECHEVVTFNGSYNQFFHEDGTSTYPKCTRPKRGTPKLEEISRKIAELVYDSGKAPQDFRNEIVAILRPFITPSCTRSAVLLEAAQIARDPKTWKKFTDRNKGIANITTAGRAIAEELERLAATPASTGEAKGQMRCVYCTNPIGQDEQGWKITATSRYLCHANGHGYGHVPEAPAPTSVPQAEPPK